MSQESRTDGNDGCTAGTAHSAGDAVLTRQSIALLRFRVANRFYDEPRVLDEIARALVRSGELATP